MHNYDRRVAYLTGNPDELARGSQVMTNILGHLKVLHWRHWTAHWQTSGPPYYGDHLMYERMKDATYAEIDPIAEKAIGYYGIQAVDPGSVNASAARSEQFLMMPDVDLAHQMLAAEQRFLGVLDQSYNQLKSLNKLPMGIDDLLMSMSGTHESHVFLLQQRVLGS